MALTEILQGNSVAGLGGPTVQDYAELIVRGGWPALVRDGGRSASDYLTSYLEDVARVDLPASDLTVDPIRMLALIRALARNVASEASATSLGKEAEIGQGSEPSQTVSAQSVRRYLDALSRVFVIEEQPAWAVHLRSKARVRVQPKWHFIDPSLAAAEHIDSAAANLKKLREKVSQQRVDQLRSLNIVTAGKFSFTRHDGVNVVALGHLGLASSAP